MTEEILALGPGGWAGATIAFAVAIFYVFRFLYRNDSLSGANTQGSIDAITRLYELLDAERRDKAALQILVREANERADQANKDRNDTIREIGELKAQLASLQLEVRMLRERGT